MREGGDAPYEILRRAEARELSSQRSAWSLRRAKSMRVQQWGSWIAYEDPELEQVVSGGAGRGPGRGRWSGECVVGDQRPFFFLRTGGAQVFWYNHKSGDHSWDPPEEVLEMQRADLEGGGGSGGGSGGGPLQSKLASFGDLKVGLARAPPTPPPPAPELRLAARRATRSCSPVPPSTALHVAASEGHHRGTSN